MSQFQQALRRMIAESKAQDETWISETTERTGLRRELVAEKHEELVRLAQRSHYTIRQLEREVTDQLQRGVVLSAAIRAVRLRVAGGELMRVMHRGVRR